MRKLAIFLLVAVGCLALACRKETSQNGPVENNAQIEMEFDGEPLQTIYRENDPNECTLYSFGGVRGYYFGLTTSFSIGDDASVTITLGTELGDRSRISDSILLRLIAPGEKQFGQLGAFSSHPQMKPGMAEITLTDKKSRRWSSTWISESESANGLDVQTKVEQSGSEFRINDIAPLHDASRGRGFRVRGQFDCVLYEMNGHGKKKLKGTFVGVVFPNG